MLSTDFLLRSITELTPITRHHNRGPGEIELVLQSPRACEVLYGVALPCQGLSPIFFTSGSAQRNARWIAESPIPAGSSLDFIMQTLAALRLDLVPLTADLLLSRSSFRLFG